MEPKMETASNIPTVGDEIYVAEDYFGNTRLYTGGRAKISKVRCAKISGTVIHMIMVEGRPFINYNWEDYLSQKQEKLQKKFGNTYAELIKKI